MNYILEKKCHAWIGIWWQVKESKEIVFKSKRKKDCVFYMNGKIQSGGGMVDDHKLGDKAALIELVNYNAQ